MLGQEIKCSVTSCKFNDKSRFCSLNDIVVGNDSRDGNAKSKKDTECVSFEAE